MPRRDYWWLVSRDENGKTVLIFGSDRSEDDARQKGLELLAGTDFRIKKLHTRDLGSASAEFRGKKLEETHSITRATERMVHERGLRRGMIRRHREILEGE